jgi:hypothetical protein
MWCLLLLDVLPNDFDGGTTATTGEIAGRPQCTAPYLDAPPFDEPRIPSPRIGPKKVTGGLAGSRAMTSSRFS